MVYKCLLTQNDCYKKGQTITPRGIMIHSTGANNPELRRYVQPDDGRLGKNQYDNHWNRPGLSVCVHAFIGRLADDTVAIYQTLPWNCRGWHCGGSGNDTHISFEICEDNLENESYFRETMGAAAALTAILCGEFHLNPLEPGVIVDHREGYRLGIASGHSDVAHWWSRFGFTMDDFRELVAKAMEPEFCTPEEVRAIIAADRAGRTYKTLSDVPDWGRDVAARLVDRGVLQGDGNSLNLSYDLLRTLAILDRLKLLDGPSGGG